MLKRLAYAVAFGVALVLPLSACVHYATVCDDTATPECATPRTVEVE